MTWFLRFSDLERSRIKLILLGDISAMLMILFLNILIILLYFRQVWCNKFNDYLYNVCNIFQIVSLTELMAGVKAPPRTVQLFQLTCWPMGHRVPTSTNSLVELMNMVERWRQRTDYGPVVVVSQWVWAFSWMLQR